MQDDDDLLDVVKCLIEVILLTHRLVSRDKKVLVLLPTRLNAGDIIVSTSRDLSGLLIRKVTRSGYSHAALVIQPTSTLFEAMDDFNAIRGLFTGQPTGNLQVVRTLNKSYISAQGVTVLRATSISASWRGAVAAVANSTGSSYYAPLLAVAGVFYEYRDKSLLFETLAHLIVCIHRASGIPSAYCSQFIANAFESVLRRKIFIKPTEFILPKDLKINEDFELINNCTRAVPCSWIPSVPPAPMSFWYNVLREIVRLPTARRALEEYWHHRDPMLSRFDLQAKAREPASAFDPILNRTSLPGAVALDHLAYAVMLQMDYRNQLLASVTRTMPSSESDQAWQDEVRSAEDVRIEYERNNAMKYKMFLYRRLEDWPESVSLRYLHDLYSVLVTSYAAII